MLLLDWPNLSGCPWSGNRGSHPGDGSPNLPTRTRSVTTVVAVVYEARTPDLYSGESGANRTATPRLPEELVSPSKFKRCVDADLSCEKSCAIGGLAKIF